MLRRTLPALAPASVAVGLLSAAPSAGATPDTTSAATSGADRAAQELPFPCGERWTGTTRSTHSPSRYAVDFNRDQDLGRRVLASSGGLVSRVGDAGDRSYRKWVRIDHPAGTSRSTPT